MCPSPQPGPLVKLSGPSKSLPCVTRRTRAWRGAWWGAWRGARTRESPEEYSGPPPPGPQRGGRALLVGGFPARTRNGGSGAPRSLLLALGAHSEAPLAGAPESPDGTAFPAA